MNYYGSKKLLFSLLFLCSSAHMLQADRVPTLKMIIYLDWIKRFTLTKPEHADFAVMLGFPRSLKHEMKQAILGKKMIKAAKNKDWKIVEKLINQGADVNMPDDETCNTALMYAIVKSTLTWVKFLVAHGAQINIQNKYGNTALILAALGSSSNILEYLVEKGADVNIQNKHGGTALMAALDLSGLKGLLVGGTFVSLNMMRILLKHGADVNHKAKNRNTALAKAMLIEDQSFIDLLKAHGAT